MNRLLVDFETRSRADIKKVGGRNYANHPSTEVLCAVLYSEATGVRTRWLPGDPVPPCVKPGREVVAHNAEGFDRHVWASLGWPEPPRWVDTAQLARRAGLPRADLDFCALHFLDRHKDKAGNALTLMLSRLNVRYGDIPEELHAETRAYLKAAKAARKGAKNDDAGWLPVPRRILERVIEYCEQDVEDLRGFYPELIEWDDCEPEVLAASRACEDRGIRFDRRLAKVLLILDDCLAEEACAAARVKRSQVKSNPQFLALMAEAGMPIPNAQAKTIEKALAKAKAKGKEKVVRLCEARAASSSIAAGKLRAGLLRVSPDGLLRDNLVYIGAHTWRFSGKGVQLQNLAKGKPLPTEAEAAKAAGADDVAKWLEKQPFEVRDALVEEQIQRLCAGDCEGIGAKQVNTLLRACFRARKGCVLSVVDYSQVEARALAWAAGDEEALAEFCRPDADPYRALASKLFGIPRADITKDQRAIGKVTELACGYGMGHKKFAEKCLLDGVDLAAQGLTAEQVVGMYRDAHWPITQFWRDIENAALQAVKGRTTKVGPFEWGRVGSDVWCMLPSGRPIVYHRMSARQGKFGRPELVYVSRKGLEHTYGGKLVENVIQAFCRDLLAAALANLEAAGMGAELHVHDESLTSVPLARARQLHEKHVRIMRRVPAWAEGMPIGAEGFLSARYRK